jgi:hypothetical protein
MAIIKETDPAIVALKDIVENQLQIPTKFVFANIFEFNSDADLVKDADFPCFLYFAVDKSKYRVNEAGILIRTIPIVGMMLTQIEQPTTDYKSEEVNPIITQMRRLAENMVYKINQHQYSRFFDEKDSGGVKDFQADSVYGKYDKHIYGVGVTLDWKMSEGITGCHH